MPSFIFQQVGASVPTLFLLLSLLPATSAQSLSDSLTAYVGRLAPTTRVNLAVQSLTDSSIAFALGADVPVAPASVIKLAIMLEAMEQVKANRLDLSDIHILTDSEKTGGAGVLKTYAHRSRIAYGDLLRLMMVYSDNTATNIFIDELGMEAINQRMKAVGLENSRLNRVMMDTLAVRQGRENVVTAHEMNALLKKIYHHEVATPALCNQMLDLLKQNQDSLTILRLLPEGTVVAHKTGELSYIRGDAGIVFGNARRVTQPFLLTVFVAGVPTPEAERIIGEIALICYLFFSPER